MAFCLLNIVVLNIVVTSTLLFYKHVSVITKKISKNTRIISRVCYVLLRLTFRSFYHSLKSPLP